MFKLDDRWVRWLLVPAIVFISQATNDAYLSDFWHHLARGREMARTGQLLDHDIFTYTVPGRAFLDVNWGTQVVYYQLYSLGELDLVRVVNALVLAGAWAWIVGICKRQSGSLEIAMAVGLATFLGCWQVLTIRPQTVSILLFVGMYDVLLRAEKDWRWLCVTPVFLAIWANAHGAFPAGLMLIGMFTAGRVMDVVLSLRSAASAPLSPRYSGGRGVGGEGGTNPLETPSPQTGATNLREGPPPLTPTLSPRSTGGRGSGLFTLAVWGMACGACAAATLVNPYGFEIYEYARHTSGISARRGIDEWLPPSWDQGIGVAFFVSLPILVGVLGWSWKKGRRVSWREAFLLALFGFLAVGSIRMVLWWLIIIAPMLALRLADFWPRSRSVQYQPNLGATLTVIGLLGFCVLSLPPLHAFNPLLKLKTPDETMANLEEAYRFISSQQEKGNVFTKLEWGEYLGWRGKSKWRVFMDGRIEIYPDEVWEMYESFTRNREPGSSQLPFMGAHYYVFDESFHRKTGLLPYPNAINCGFNEVWRKGDVGVYTFFQNGMLP